MSIDPMVKLEEARVRLVTGQNLADDVESHARRLLDMLEHEVQAWQIATSEVKSEIAAATTRLNERWSDLQNRVEVLSARARDNLDVIGTDFAGHWKSGQALWDQCALKIDSLHVGVTDQISACVSTRNVHVAEFDRDRTALTQMAMGAEKIAITDLNARAKLFDANALEVKGNIETFIAGVTKQVDMVSASAHKRKEAWDNTIEEYRKGFDSSLDNQYSDFATAIDFQIGELTKSATEAQERLNEAIEAVDDTAEDLFQGADQVVDVLNTTNVGLSTVVEIVQDAVSICEEIVNAFDG